jgi:hypothetical protein
VLGRSRIKLPSVENHQKMDSTRAIHGAKSDSGAGRGPILLAARLKDLITTNTLQHSLTYHQILIHLRLLFLASFLPVFDRPCIVAAGCDDTLLCSINIQNSIATNRPIRQLSACRRVPTTVTDRNVASARRPPSRGYCATTTKPHR